MREIVLDTETTGLDPASGHRLVEIACLELVPEPWKLTQKFPAELDALHKAATGRKPTKKKPAPKKKAATKQTGLSSSTHSAADDPGSGRR